MRSNIEVIQDLINEKERLRNVLDLAISVIISYQMDIRNSKWTGVNLKKKGFCQGRVYKRAIKAIYKIAKIDIDKERRDADKVDHYEHKIF